jgi:exodeoxyribonuclease V gamma subunit
VSKGPNVVVSNRTESLVDALCERLTQTNEQTSPLDREVVVVQGRGMAVWLNLELARRFGVSANIDVLYPRNLVTWAFEQLLPGAAGESDYSRSRLFWTILAKLPELLPEAEFRQLASYLEGDSGGLRRVQLAERIAATFDEYLTFRPDLLERWSKAARSRRKAADGRPQLSLFGSATADSTERWQERLWQTLRAELGDSHPALKEAKLAASAVAGRVAPRVSVFGLSSLPPLFLRILLHVGKRTELDFYLLGATKKPEAEVKHVLFTASGTVEREFRGLLEQSFRSEGVDATFDLRFAADAGDTLLRQLQGELAQDRDATSLRVASTDTSLRFHSCHGPTREIEVLHDQLLQAIHEKGYQPHEIVVMAPNIEDYAPLIEAVFERHTSDPTFVPYRISDRRPQSESEVVLGLSGVVALVSTRVSSAEVLDLLTQTKVRERFGISADDLAVIRRWVTEAGARWGIDSTHRGHFDVPAEHANTWRFALDRLLLGYSLATGGTELSLGVLPYDEIEGKTGELLGRFATFLETLFAELAALRAPRTVDEWQVALTHCLSSLFTLDDVTAWQHQLVLQALSELVARATEARFADKLELQAVYRLLDAELDQQRSARGFLSGGVTFCAMTPMRSIPFRLVWLLGMNEGAFPRQTFRPDFNLIDKSADGRRPCDPDRRLDDRMLFLECLLCARDELVLSFVGQSIRNNAKTPPSVVVSELLDGILDRAIDEHGVALSSKHLVLEHPLQPFSPRYYQGAAHETARQALFSFEENYRHGASLLLGERRQATALFDVDLPELSEPLVQLDDLAAFFSAPTDALLRKRLGVDLRDQLYDVPEREPSVLDGLELYGVGAMLLAHLTSGIPEDESIELIRATGLLPSGASGDFEFRRALASAKPIAAMARRVAGIRCFDRYAADVALDEQNHVQGDLGTLFARGLLHAQFARVSPKHILQTWLRHLVLCAVQPKGVQLQSTLLGRREGPRVKPLVYATVPEPLPILRSLVDLYRVGQRRPLPFFPSSSLSVVLREQKTHKGLLSSANHWKEELSRSPALKRIYGDVQLLPSGPEGFSSGASPSFRDVAFGVYAPLLSYLSDEEDDS